MSQYYICSIRAKSFKSIGDQWLECKFEKGLNAIVGINGAGKSTLLQAICFAAAGPLSVLGVSKLNELRHIGSNEVCEVQLLLRPCTPTNTSSKSKKKLNGANEDVLVHAWINPEGNRVFRLNNRIVSGKEVKNKLGRIGVHLGTSTSLILQSAVTELADSTDPLALAAVIADCSGLQTWAKEAANAHAELEAQAKDELSIRQKIDTLTHTSAAARLEASKGEKYAELEAQAEEVAASCDVKLRALQSVVGRKRELIVEMLEKSSERQIALQQQEVRAQQQLARLREQQQGLVNIEDMSDSSSKAKKLRLTRVSINEELYLVAHQLNTYESAATALHAALAREKDAAHRFELTLQEIKSLEQGLHEIEMHYSSLHASIKAQQEVASTQSQLLEAQHEMAVTAAALQQAHRQLNEAAAEMEQADITLQEYKSINRNIKSSSLPDGDVDTQLATFAAAKAELQFKHHALVSKQQNLPSKSSLNKSGLPTLDQCFTFKDTAKVASHYAAALELLAGRRLNIAVAQTTQQAAQLLSSGRARGLRIWALDSISSLPDRIQIHRQVAASFQPAGSVIVPMDLLSYDPSHAGVIAKAFGSHVIVSSIQVGREVMEQYGIPSIALDGTVTSRGRLAGGWVSPEQQRRGPMHSKIKLEFEKANLDAVVDELRKLEAAELSLQAHINAEAAHAAAEEAVLKFKEAQAEVLSAESNFHKAENLVRGLEMDLTSRQAVAAAFDQGHNQVETLHAQIDQQKRLLESLKDEKAAAAAEVATAMAACSPGGQHEELQAGQAQLQESLKEIDHQILILDGQCREQQQKRSAAQKEDEACCHREVAAAADALRAASLELAGLREQLDSLDTISKEIKYLAAQVGIPPSIDNTNEDDSFGNGPLPDSSFSEIQSMVEEVRAVAANHATLITEIFNCKPSRGSRTSTMDAVANYRAAEIAERELALLRPHADDMHSIATKLAEGIQLMNPYAEKINESVFDDVAEFFKFLTAQLLPGIELQVTRVNESDENAVAAVHRHGAQFSYRRTNGTHEKWITGLEALSGGQRTLISLAYLVAAKLVGGGALSFSSSVLLADEVDAALDTGNQEQAARLLGMLCTKKDKSQSRDNKPPLAQVICISHSPVFQQLCDKVIKLTRNSENGATMLA